MEVAIIGAGMAGLGAAYSLVKSGFKQITIYEAQDYIGGRIKSMEYDDAYLELGAQWIHGQEDNILYEMASKRDLISNIAGHEGVGYFCTQNGTKIDSELVNKVIMFLDSIKKFISAGDYKLNYQNSDIKSEGKEIHVETTVADVFKICFDKWIESKPFKSPHDVELSQGILHWFMKFETIDNSCSSFDHLSVISYLHFRKCDGNYLNNFKSGYSSFLKSLIEDMPEVKIKLSCPVKRVIYNHHFSTNSQNTASLILEDGSIVYANHIIITNSIGFLKKNIDTFFEPQLPLTKRNIIQALGFGTVNKIYLIFDKPFWHPCDLGFQLVWLENEEKENLSQYPPWVYDISGIDTVWSQPNVLVAWIGGKGAELIENENDQSLTRIFHSLLTQFVSSVIQNEKLKPIKIIRTAWYSNRFVQGAYSHRTVAYAKLNVSIDELTKPLTILYQSNDETNTNRPVDWPLVLFAGEATDNHFFSTTHGAFSTGVREAARLIQFWANNKSNK